MQELIKEAAKIKSAQLKSRAGRQPWENAPRWFRLIANLPPELTALREKGIEERLDASMRLKEDGNEALTKLNDPHEAIEKYVTSIGLFIWFERRGKGGEVLEDVPLVSSLNDGRRPGIDDEVSDQDFEAMRDQATAHIASCFSNIALCLLKLARESEDEEEEREGLYGNEAEGALFACNKALELDPYNVRALFRRSEARSLLPGAGFDELEASVSDLEAALKLEPGNAQVRSSLGEKKEELRDLKRKSRAALSTLFDGRDGSKGLYDSKESDAYAGGDGAEIGGRNRALEKLRERAVGVRVRNGAGAGAGQKRGGGSRGFIETLSYVPWWGWLLILAHLAYRIYHIWRAHTVVTDDLDLRMLRKARLDKMSQQGHNEL